MKECPLCFHEVLEDSPVCPLCGADLAGSFLSPLVGPPRQEEKRFLLKEDLNEEIRQFQKQFEERGIFLGEKVLHRAGEILRSAETEMRRASVLLVDMRGFSRLGAKVSPEELSRFQKEFYSIVTDCILRRAGFVVEFIGDAVLAVFGAPVAFDFDTESAIDAALDITESCLQTQWEYREIIVRMGIATGPIQSGLMDAPYGKAYHIVGGTINLAARLQAAAGTNEILVCSTTWDIAKRAFDGEPTPPLSLKNISEDYVAYKILRRKDRELPLRLFQTPFCGRKKELDDLLEYLSREKGCGVRIVHIQGEAGIGKSRLVHEALGKLGREKNAVWWKAAPSTSSILLSPIIEWLREELNLSLHAPRDTITTIIKEFFKKKFPKEDADPLLLEYLFGVPEAVSALRGTPPERIQKNLFALLRRLLFSAPEECGELILIADDAQWFDPLTAKFLSALAEWPESSRLILFLVYRSGVDPFIKKEKEHLALHLEPLKERERHDLLRTLSSAEEFLPEVRDIILSRGAGNPLFLEEMSKLVREISVEYNHLNGEALTNKIIEIIPVSLHDLIQSRIDRLETRTRQVLQCASLLGMEFVFSLIRMFEIIQEGLEDHLHALRALRYLEEQPEPEDIRYYFTHGLFKDVAYSTLLEEQKERLHASLAHRLEEVFQDRIQEYCELLAYHFSRGNRPQKAIYYLVKAADRQAGLGADSNALENYSTAIELLKSLPPHPSRIALMSRLLTHAGRLQRKLGEMHEAEEMLGAALDCANKIDNPRLALEARLERAVCMVWKGENDPAAENLSAIIEDAVKMKAPLPEMVALLSLGVLEWHRGSFDKALVEFQNLAKLADKVPVFSVKADAFNNAGLIYWKWGQLSQALKNFKQAIPLRRKIGDQFGLAATLMNIGVIQEQMGKIEGARRSYQNALSLAQKTGYTQALAALESNLSNLDRRMGLPSSALVHANRAVEFARSVEDPKIEADALENAGLALFHLNQPDQALAHLQSALDLALTHKHQERITSIRISLLEINLGIGNEDGDDLEEINGLLKEIENLKFMELKPRIFRLKAQILELLDKKNKLTAKDYLDMALEIAGNTGNVFEQMDTLRALISWAEKKGREDERKGWEYNLETLEKMLNR